MREMHLTLFQNIPDSFPVHPPYGTSRHLDLNLYILLQFTEWRAQELNKGLCDDSHLLPHPTTGASKAKPT